MVGACWASLLGVLAALLAIPTAAAIQIVLRDWWRTVIQRRKLDRHRVSGDRGGRSPQSIRHFGP